MAKITIEISDMDGNESLAGVWYSLGQVFREVSKGAHATIAVENDAGEKLYEFKHTTGEPWGSGSGPEAFKTMVSWNAPANRSLQDVSKLHYK